MNRRKNLLVLTPDLAFGGAQRAVHYMSSYLSEHYNVYECVFDTNEPIAFSSANTFIDLKVPAGKTFLQKIWFFWLRCYRVWKIKKKYEIDVTVSHLEGADYVNIFTRRKDKIIICIQGSKLHDGEIRGLMGWIRKSFFMPVLYRMTDHIVPVSRDLVKELTDGMKLSTDRITVIENACDIGMVDSAKKVPLPPEWTSIMQDYKVIVTVGRMANQKNQLSLLPVISTLLKERKGLKFFLLGDGPLRPQTITETEKLGLRAYYAWEQMPIHDQYDVYYLGFRENPFNVVKHSTLFVFPSLWEGFPLALIEALACDIPIITSDCPTGPREVANGRLLKDNETITEPEWAEYAVLMPALNRSLANYVQQQLIWKDAIVKMLDGQMILESYRQRAYSRAEYYSCEVIYTRWKILIDKIIV